MMRLNLSILIVDMVKDNTVGNTTTIADHKTCSIAATNVSGMSETVQTENESEKLDWDELTRGIVFRNCLQVLCRQIAFTRSEKSELLFLSTIELYETAHIISFRKETSTNIVLVLLEY
jgi:hypothetical protein